MVNRHICGGKYTLLQKLGQGSTGSVYLGEEELTGRTVAVKIGKIREEERSDICAFAAEAEILSHLAHPCIPALTEYGTTYITTDDEEKGGAEYSYVVMEYFEGETLRELLERHERFSAEEALKRGIQICRIFEYLHSGPNPVIFRDIKPSNLILRTDGEIALVDFGAARYYRGDDRKEDTEKLGTRGYAAPEQYGGQGESDRRTDIYGFGALMYRMISGRSVIEGERTGYRADLIEKSEAAEKIFEMIRNCCESDRERRPKNFQQIRRELEEIQREFTSENRKAGEEKGEVTRLGVRIMALAAVLIAAGVFFRAGGIPGTAAQASEHDLFSVIQNTPEDESAYLMLLHDAAADGELTDSEKERIDYCIYSVPTDENGNSGERSCLQILRQNNPAGYERFCFEAGCVWFSCDNTENGLQRCGWFLRDIEDSTALTAPERKLAHTVKRYCEIREEILQNNMNAPEEAADLWTEMLELSGNAEKLPGEVGGYEAAIAYLHSQAMLLLYTDGMREEDTSQLNRDDIDTFWKSVDRICGEYIKQGGNSENVLRKRDSLFEIREMMTESR